MSLPAKEQCLEWFNKACGKELEVRKPSRTYYISEQTMVVLIHLAYKKAWNDALSALDAQCKPWLGSSKEYLQANREVREKIRNLKVEGGK